MQTLTKRTNTFDVENEHKRGDLSSSTQSKTPSASRLLAEKRPLTCDEQTSIITEAEDTLLFNDKLASTAFSFLILLEGFVFLFFGIADVRTYLMRHSAGGDGGMSLAMKSGGVGTASLSDSGIDGLCEALSHLIVCGLAFSAAYFTFGKRSLKRSIVHNVINAKRVEGEMMTRQGGFARSRSNSTYGGGGAGGGSTMLMTTAPPPPLPPAPTFPPPPPMMTGSALPPPPLPPTPPSMFGGGASKSSSDFTNVVDGSPNPRSVSMGRASSTAHHSDNNDASLSHLSEVYDSTSTDDEPTISIQLNTKNIDFVRKIHKRTAILSLCLAAPLIILSTALSSTGESFFLNPTRWLLCLWQPFQHAVMLWAAKALVEDVVGSLEQLKRAQYKYQDA